MDRIDWKRIQVLKALENLQDGQPASLVAAHVMTPKPSCVSMTTNVIELIRMIHANAFRHLLVVDDVGRLVGVISDRDVLRCLGPGTVDKELLARTLAQDLMSTDLMTISPQTPLVQAIAILLDQGISCLPIVEDERLLGIMTNTDLHVVLEMLLQTARTTTTEQSFISVRI